VARVARLSSSSTSPLAAWSRFDLYRQNAFAYFETLKDYRANHGRPLALSSDKHSIFRVSKPQAQGRQGMTQFSRALSELSIEILCANSSQAKGRMERARRTLQDRLLKELRLEKIVHRRVFP
jgi:hypothetical protein